MWLRLLWRWHSEPNSLLSVCCNFQRPNWGHLRWTDTWSHSADDKLWSRLELDIVIIEGKQALTAVTVAAAEDQQTPQGTLPTVVTCDAYRAVSWGRRTKERVLIELENESCIDSRWQQLYGAFTEVLQREDSMNRWLGFYYITWNSSDII